MRNAERLNAERGTRNAELRCQVRVRCELTRQLSQPAGRLLTANAESHSMPPIRSPRGAPTRNSSRPLLPRRPPFLPRTLSEIELVAPLDSSQRQTFRIAVADDQEYRLAIAAAVREPDARHRQRIAWFGPADHGVDVPRSAFRLPRSDAPRSAFHLPRSQVPFSHVRPHFPKLEGTLFR
jgi:hypothetical protein